MGQILILMKSVIQILNRPQLIKHIYVKKYKQEMYPDSDTINYDFEKAVINVIQITFDENMVDCFHNLCQKKQNDKYKN